MTKNERYEQKTIYLLTKCYDARIRMHHSLKKQDTNTQVLEKEGKRALTRSEVHELLEAEVMKLLASICNGECSSSEWIDNKRQILEIRRRK